MQAVAQALNLHAAEDDDTTRIQAVLRARPSGPMKARSSRDDTWLSPGAHVLLPRRGALA